MCFIDCSKNICKQIQNFLNILIWLLGHDQRGLILETGIQEAKI